MGAEDSMDACDLKTAHANSLFLCLVSAGECDEVAVGERVGDFGDSKSASLWVGGLA